MADFVSIGKILSTRGLRGELRLRPTARDLGRFAQLKRIFVQRSETAAAEEFRIARVWQHKNVVILQLEGIPTIELAEPLVGHDALVPAAEAVDLEPDEYFVHDLIGMTVQTDTGRELGILESVLEGSANDIYVVRGKYGEVLVPAVGSLVLEVDLERRRLLVHDLPGLVEPEAPV